MTGYDVVLMGEAIVDFVPIDQTLPGKYEAHAGGAPCNVACGLARLGAKTAVLSRVGKDPLGRCLLNTLEGCGVNTDYIQIDAERFTTVTIVMPQSETEDMMRYAIFREGSADGALCYEEIPKQLFSNVRVLHYGSLSMASEESSETMRRAIQIARAHGAITSMDVNLRPNSWKNRTEMRDKTLELIAQSDIVKLTREEAVALELDVRHLALQGRTVLVTDGAKPAAIYAGNLEAVHEIPDVKTKDVTGGGDAFMAAFLYCYLNYDGERMTLPFLEKALRFCIAASSYAVQQYGAIDSLPSLEQTLALMKTV